MFMPYLSTLLGETWPNAQSTVGVYNMSAVAVQISMRADIMPTKHSQCATMFVMSSHMEVICGMFSFKFKANYQRIHQ